MKKRLFIYDFETNGFYNKFNQPIQVAAKIIELDGSESNYTNYIKCPYHINKSITEINGITDEILAEKGVPIKKVFADLNAIIRKGETLIIGHNILRFDNLFLNNFFDMFNHERIEAKNCFDTLGQIKSDLMDLKKPKELSWGEFHNKCISNNSVKDLKTKLNDACEYYGVNCEGANFHNAEADVEFTYQVFLKQIEKIKSTLK